MANGVDEACWLRQLLQELHASLSKSTLVYCDNVSAVYLSTNPVQHQSTKHVEFDLHFIREHVAIMMSVSCISQRPPSSWTSLQRVCPLWCFRIFGPVSIFVVATVSTVGGCWKMCCNISILGPGPPPM
jgi:hypothetical protein